MVGRPKGTTGTPRTGGRQKGTKNVATRDAKVGIEMMCRLQSPAAVRALAMVAVKGKSEAARVSAAVALLDRGYGKPRQSIDVEGNLTIKDLTDEQLEQRFAELLRKA